MPTEFVEERQATQVAEEVASAWDPTSGAG